MLKDFLREVVEIVVGKQAEEIADLLNSKKHVNEFIIAKRLGITINQTRNILYRLSDQGLVSSMRKKDKRKGWYTYFWKIEVLKALEFLEKQLLRKKEQTENQLTNREAKEFYVCDRCKIELNSEHALTQDFSCNECGEIMSLKDNTKLVRDLKRELERLNRKLAILKKEIDIQLAILEKQREKEEKKLVKEKAAKRAKARKLSAKNKLPLKKGKAGKKKEAIKKKSKAKGKKKPKKKVPKKRR